MQDQVNTLAKFNFNGAAIRVVEINGKPHFVGKDVADCLGYKNSRAAFSQHCKGVVKHDIPSASGNQSYSVIPESDVFRLILRSKAQHAEKFQDWVCEEVLPAIRQTGEYSVKPKPPTYGDLARMVLEQEEKLGIAGEIFHAVLPTTKYGSLAPNGQERTGIRRAAFVAAKNRINDAVDLLKLSAQMELQLADEESEGLKAFDLYLSIIKPKGNE